MTIDQQLAGIDPAARRRAYLLPPQGRRRPRALRLDGDLLVYRPGTATAGEAIDYTGALGAFLRMKDADGVLKFAQRYGPLALCAHGVPATHNPTIDDPVGIDRGLGCRPVRRTADDGEDEYTEPVAAWLRLAAQARAILDVAASLHHNRRPDARSWRLAMGYSEDGTGATAAPPTPIDPGRLADCRDWLSVRISWWLLFDPPRPAFHWRKPRPDVVLVCGTFGHIALQLAAACAGTADLMRCDGCRQPYIREGRRAQAGRRNYCPDCRDSGAPQRDAKADFRQRQAQQRGRAPRRRAANNRR